MRSTKLLHWAAAIVLATSTAVVGVAQSASAAPVNDYIGEIKNVLTWQGGVDKAMAVLNASTANTTPLIQAPYTAVAPHNDRIVLERENTANVFRLKPEHTYSYDGNVFNDKCLAVKNNDFGDNIPIVNATCTYDSTNNDVWFMVAQRVDVWIVYEFRNQATGKCITTQNASTAANARLVTFTCNGGRNGQWMAGLRPWLPPAK